MVSQSPNFRSNSADIRSGAKEGEIECTDEPKSDHLTMASSFEIQNDDRIGRATGVERKRKPKCERGQLEMLQDRSAEALCR